MNEERRLQAIDEILKLRSDLREPSEGSWVRGPYLVPQLLETSLGTLLEFQPFIPLAEKSPNASLVKQLIGQSIVHTLSEEFDFVYCLFHDESTGKKIKKSIGNQAESRVISRMRDDFNLYLRFV